MEDNSKTKPIEHSIFCDNKLFIWICRTSEKTTFLMCVMKAKFSNVAGTMNTLMSLECFAIYKPTCPLGKKILVNIIQIISLIWIIKSSLNLYMSQ